MAAGQSAPKGIAKSFGSSMTRVRELSPDDPSGSSSGGSSDCDSEDEDDPGDPLDAKFGSQHFETQNVGLKIHRYKTKQQAMFKTFGEHKTMTTFGAMSPETHKGVS